LAITLFDQPLMNATDRGAFSWFNGQELADQFALSGTATVTGIAWYGTFWQTDLPPEETEYPFVVRFFDSTKASDSGISLGDPTTATSDPFYEVSVLARVVPSGVRLIGTDGGLDAVDRTTYKFSIEGISGPVLFSSTEYWISILSNGPVVLRWANSPVSEASYSVYRFVYLNETDWAGFSNAPGNLPVGDNRGNLSFTLDGILVPEPSSMATVALGLAGCLCLLLPIRPSKARLKSRTAEQNGA